MPFAKRDVNPNATPGNFTSDLGGAAPVEIGANSFNQSNVKPPAMGENFPDPNKSVKLPRKSPLAMLRDAFSWLVDSVFSPEAEMLTGYCVALASVSAAIVGYYAIANSIAVPLGLAGWSLFGANVMPLLLGTAAALLIQWTEIAPRKFEIFPGLADKAAFKAGREKMVNPAATNDTASMLPTYKYFARNGDSIRNSKIKLHSKICYVIEGIGAFCAIGVYLGSMNPVIVIGAVVYGFFAVVGCELGLSRAQKAKAESLTAAQLRDYKVEKGYL